MTMFRKRLAIAIAVTTMIITCGVVGVENSDAPAWLDTMLLLAVWVLAVALAVEILREQ